ncbi:MAG: universal stress protein [Saprospiraceae bacterium]|nr:universal stress protein [Saprospiraceae bacterium]
MKKIVVPTDFSDSAQTATTFAVNLAFHLKVDVELVHILNPATDLNTGYMIDPGIEKVRRDQLEDATRAVKEKLSGELADEIVIMSSFHLGFPIEEIVNISKGQDALIVVGATGESGVMDRVFGSIPVHLARRAYSPVLIVPNNVKFDGFSEIAYASAEPALDRKVAAMLFRFVDVFDARLHAVHIGKEDNYPIWHIDEAVPGVAAPPTVLKKNIDRVDVISALNQYCSEEQIDLLIMSTRHRKFWDSIIHTSMTREMALEPHLPLLVFHEHDSGV